MMSLSWLRTANNPLPDGRLADEEPAMPLLTSLAGTYPIAAAPRRE
jgi:hypothetical protein